ncbi:MAG: VOC family protein [Opitutaceae bacterium]|nr:VOC family protein [Cytophagales bacterium]
MRTFPGTFNHISLHVSDLVKSLHFYTQLLGMEEVQRPAFSFKGAWLSMGNAHLLHLIEGKDYETKSSNRGNHFAFSNSDVNGLEADFVTKGIEVVSNKIRVDGVRQLFVKDPDGYYIEFSEEVFIV